MSNIWVSMSLLDLILVSLFMLFVVACFKLIKRMQQLYRYLRKLEHRAEIAAKNDLYKGRNGTWRIEAVHELPVSKMIFVFWRDFSSFVPGFIFDPDVQPHQAEQFRQIVQR